MYAELVYNNVFGPPFVICMCVQRVWVFLPREYKQCNQVDVSNADL